MMKARRLLESMELAAREVEVAMGKKRRGLRRWLLDRKLRRIRETHARAEIYYIQLQLRHLETAVHQLRKDVTREFRKHAA